MIKRLSYSATTYNGIPYVKSLYDSNFDYQVCVDDLNALYPVRMEIVQGRGTVQTYTIGSRSITRSQMTASEILSLWDKLMAKKKQLEGVGSVRKMVGAVPRDW